MIDKCHKRHSFQQDDALNVSTPLAFLFLWSVLLPILLQLKFIVICKLSYMHRWIEVQVQ